MTSTPPRSNDGNNDGKGRTTLTTVLYSTQLGQQCKYKCNFGPMEDILQETQLTEHEFFPLVMQLLHGKEMDYMTGGM